jgi:hypothetical protein
MENEKIPLALLLAVIVLYLFLVFQTISSFASLPGPLFGGDVYFQLGAITYIYRTAPTEWFSSTNGIGSLPGYLPAYGITTTLFGKLLGFAPETAMLNFNMLIVPLSLIFFYLFFRELFGSSWFALAGTVAAVSYTAFPITKYTNFTAFITVPLFLYCALVFFKKQDLKTSLALGVLYGVMSLSHGTAFFFSSAFLAALAAASLWSERGKADISASSLLQSKKYIILAILLGLAISMLYWFQPIFVYHGQSKLESLNWGFEDFGMPNVQKDFLVNSLAQLFMDTTSLFRLAVSLLTIVGLAILVKNRKNLQEHEKFIAILFAVLFALTFSYFLTMPILGTHFAPGHMLGMYLIPSAVAVSLIGLGHVAKKTGKPSYVAAAFALLFCLQLISSYGAWKSDQWFVSAKSPIPQVYLEVQQWLLQNTSVHDTILTSNELGFALNGLSGNSILMTRRAQNDAFADFDAYQLDGIIILYGNNMSRKVELMRKDGVKLVYFDVNWLSHAAAGYDPPMLLYSEENERALLENGIKYTRGRDWVDPSVRGARVRKFDILVVSPENNDQSGFGPWKDDLDSILSPALRLDSQGATVAAIYRVSLPQ